MPGILFSIFPLFFKGSVIQVSPFLSKENVEFTTGTTYTTALDQSVQKYVLGEINCMCLTFMHAIAILINHQSYIKKLL